MVRMRALCKGAIQHLRPADALLRAVLRQKLPSGAIYRGQRLVRPVHRTAHMVSTLRILLVTGSLATVFSFLWPVSDLQDVSVPADNPSCIGELNDEVGDQPAHDFTVTVWTAETQFSISLPTEGFVREPDHLRSGCVLTILASPHSPPQFS